MEMKGGPGEDMIYNNNDEKFQLKYFNCSKIFG